MTGRRGMVRKSQGTQAQIHLVRGWVERRLEPRAEPRGVEVVSSISGEEPDG